MPNNVLIDVNGNELGIVRRFVPVPAVESTIIPLKIGLALSGGASKGDFQVGAARYLLALLLRPELNTKLHVVSGCSVGAINGSKIAEGQDDGIIGLEGIWTSLVKNEDMYNQEPWLNRIHSKIRQGLLDAIRGKDSGNNDLLNPIFYLPIIGGLAMAEVDKLIKELGKAQSIFNLDPIEAKLNDTSKFDPAKVQNSGIKLRLALVSMDTGKLEFADESGKLLSSGSYVGLIKAIIASAGMPVIFRPTILNGETFFDGGLRDIVPIQAAFDAGADHVYAIVASKSGVDQESYASKNLLEYLGRTIDIITDEVKENDIQIPLKDGKKLTVIQPTVDIHDGMTIDPGLIDISIAYGFMRASEALEKDPNIDKKKLMANSDRITRLRKEIWELEYEANGKHRLTNTSNTPGPNRRKLVPSAGALVQVRQKKKQLLQLFEDRFNLNGEMYGFSTPNLSRLWKGWERHAWTAGPYITTPWERFVNKAGNTVPQETPPSSAIPELNI